MKICTYCGKKYPDDWAQPLCEVDGMLLDTGTMALPPVISPPVDTPTVTVSPPRKLSDRNLRIVEIILVCFIAFGSSILASFGSFGTDVSKIVPQGSLSWTYAFLRQISGLGLLWYVLLRRSKSLLEITSRWKWSDIGWSFALYFGGSVVFGIVYRIISFSGLNPEDASAATHRVANQLFGNGIVLPTLIFIFINPFFEELIVRGYLMTEIRELTNSVPIAVTCSVLLQTSYHFYQGVPLALSEGGTFLVWSLYYAKTNRLIPIILAHLYMDVGSTIAYLFLHQSHQM